MQANKARGKFDPLLMPVISVLFVAFAAALLYIALAPVLKPYIGLINMLISSEVQVENNSRNLLSETNTQGRPDANGQNGNQNNPEDGTNIWGIPQSSIIRPNKGDQYGWLTIEDTQVSAPVFWSDSEAVLNRGIGTYTGGWLPGFGRTVMLAGHRTTDLKDLGSAQIGGIITFETHYETYKYEITNIAVYHMNDSNAYDFSRREDNIIIYTCYPFDYIGAAKERYFVYGDLISGTQVDRWS